MAVCALGGVEAMVLDRWELNDQKCCSFPYLVWPPTLEPVAGECGLSVGAMRLDPEVREVPAFQVRAPGRWQSWTPSARHWVAHLLDCDRCSQTWGWEWGLLFPVRCRVAATEYQRRRRSSCTACRGLRWPPVLRESGRTCSRCLLRPWLPRRPRVGP